MSDIAKRLRGEHWWLNVSGEEAADEIEMLHTHLEHRSDVNTHLRAEIERLTAALRRIEGVTVTTDRPTTDLEVAVRIVTEQRHIARAALEGK